MPPQKLNSAGTGSIEPKVKAPADNIIEFDDQSDLAEKEDRIKKICERRIERGLNTFLIVAASLLRIKKERLFRMSHRSFSKYCCSTWEFDDVTPEVLSKAVGVAEEFIAAKEDPKEGEEV